MPHRPPSAPRPAVDLAKVSESDETAARSRRARPTPLAPDRGGVRRPPAIVLASGSLPAILKSLEHPLSIARLAPTGGARGRVDGGLHRLVPPHGGGGAPAHRPHADRR